MCVMMFVVCFLQLSLILLLLAVAMAQALVLGVAKVPLTIAMPRRCLVVCLGLWLSADGTLKAMAVYISLVGLQMVVAEVCLRVA